MEVNTSDYSNNFNLVLHVAMVIFVKKDNKTNLWYVQNAMVIAGHVMAQAPAWYFDGLLVLHVNI